jgi:hypothetical protein
LVVFALVFGSAMLAMALHAVVPEHHLSTDSKDVVKLGIAVIATMSSLVVSLLLASANGSFDTRSREFTQMSANIILLDRLLAQYGRETKGVRDLLHSSVVDAVDRIGSSKNFQLPVFAPTLGTSQSIYSQIQQLSPQNEGHCHGNRRRERIGAVEHRFHAAAAAACHWAVASALKIRSVDRETRCR